jgi:alpha/beta superfamily hydrolase
MADLAKSGEIRQFLATNIYVGDVPIDILIQKSLDGRGANVMILCTQKYNRETNCHKCGLKIQLIMQKGIIKALVFVKIDHFFSGKLAKIAKNSEHNIDPRSFKAF